MVRYIHLEDLFPAYFSISKLHLKDEHILWQESIVAAETTHSDPTLCRAQYFCCIAAHLKIDIRRTLRPELVSGDSAHPLQTALHLLPGCQHITYRIAVVTIMAKYNAEPANLLQHLIYWQRFRHIWLYDLVLKPILFVMLSKIAPQPSGVICQQTSTLATFGLPLRHI